MPNEVKVKGGTLLARFDWDCTTGDHTVDFTAEAKDEAAVKKMLPASVQSAKIVKLNKFTAMQIKSFHEKK